MIIYILISTALFLTFIICSHCLLLTCIYELELQVKNQEEIIKAVVTRKRKVENN